QDQLVHLASAGIETIAELENTVSAILEEAELAEKESRQPKNISVPGKPPAKDGLKSKSRKGKNSDDEDYDDESEDVDDELENERLRENRRLAAKRAREAKAKKSKSKFQNLEQ
ncbi:MAG: hypothetical protein ACKO96_20630, partial [Flammeovirgaceae bacterium]